MLELYIEHGGRRDCPFKELKVRARRGSVTAIMGENGAGKSTLLDSLAGFLPFEGKLVIDGTLMSSDSKHILAYSFQGAKEILPWRTVEGNLGLPSELIAGRELDQKRLQDVLEFIGLAEKKTTRAFNLSGGQKARVSIGRCLMTKSNLMLFDEPCAALDVSVRRKIYRMLGEIADRHDCYMIMSLHDALSAVRYSDDIFLLYGSGQSPRHSKQYHGARKQGNEELVVNVANEIDKFILRSEERGACGS